MNGDGWVCDGCGAMVVNSDIDRFAMNGGVLPTGWLALMRSDGRSVQVQQRWDFCSVGCAHRKTAAVPTRPCTDPDCEQWRPHHHYIDPLAAGVGETTPPQPGGAA